MNIERLCAALSVILSQREGVQVEVRPKEKEEKEK